MEERELIICNSNMFVPYVMTECLKNKTKRYVVASDTPNINQFFELFNFDNVIQLAYSTGKVSVIYKEKKKMKSFLANYRITKVVFYHAEFGELANWLLLKFAKKGGSIEYHKLFDSIPVPEAKFNIPKNDGNIMCVYVHHYIIDDSSGKSIAAKIQTSSNNYLEYACNFRLGRVKTTFFDGYIYTPYYDVNVNPVVLG